MRRISNFLICAALCFFTVIFAVSCNKSPVKPNPVAVTAVEVKMGISNWNGYLPFFLSDKKSLLKSSKTKLSTIWFDEYLKGIVALSSGKLNANTQTLIDTVLSVAEGSDQVVVLVLDHSTGNDKIIAKAGINSIKDLKGKTITVEKGTVDHYLIMLALKKAGLSKSDVNFKYLSIEESAKAFAAGKADAVATFAPFTNIAIKAGGKELASSKDFPGAISDVLAFRTDFLDEHPEAVQEVVNSWFDALNHIKGHEAESIKLMAEQAKVTPDEYKEMDKGLQLTGHVDNLISFDASKKGTLFDTANSLKKTLIELGLTKNNPDVIGMFDDRFIKAYKPK
jgi:NitT/TauT family transport system substrate-binding protein